MAHEDEIRAALASRLHVIEHGLNLVQVNYPLPNSNGAKGFVDILARDASGMLTVIELKRADSAAREAMHEIAKYIDLLAREKAVPIASLRAIVLSTTWHELLVPFSYYANAVEFPLDGYQLELAEDGVTAAAASPIAPLDMAEARVLTEYQRQVFMPANRSVTDVWQELRKELTILQVEDVVARQLHHDTYGHCLIVALGTVTNSRPTAEWVRLLNDRTRAEDFEEEDLEDLPAEHLALMWLELGSDLPIRPSDPMKAGSLVQNHGWRQESILRAGVFEDENIFPDADLVHMLEGWGSGQSDLRFSGTAHPRNVLQWREFETSVLAAISPGSEWRLPVTLWLSQVGVASKHPVGAHIYDHQDILQALVSGWETQLLDEFTPGFAIAMQYPDHLGSGLIGTLAWDGESVDVFRAIEAAFPTPGSWADARMMHHAGPSEALRKALHLHCVVFEKNGRDDLPRLLEVVDGALRRTELRTDFLGRKRYGRFRPSSDWFAEYESEINVVVRILRNRIVVDDQSGVQVHFIDTKEAWPWPQTH